MTPLERAAGGHPSAGQLALLSTGDISWLSAPRAKLHLSRCSSCQHEVSRFRQVALELKREAKRETLTGFEAIADWPRLEREMQGNINVGVAAARCIDKTGPARYFPHWRGAALIASLSVVFTTAWLMNIPSEQEGHLANSIRRMFGMNSTFPVGTVVGTTPDGIAVRSQGTTLTLLHPASSVVTISVVGASAVGARYVDDQTGQVTITHVYGQ